MVDVLDDLKEIFDIREVPLNVILNYLMDKDGEIIDIDSEATMVWRYIKDEEDGLETYEPYIISENKCLDLSKSGDITTYQLELIIGKDGQLNPNNIRYIITVYLTSELSDLITYELYTQDEDGIRSKVKPKDIILNGTRTYLVPEHTDGTEYYLGINSLLDDHPYVKVYIYLTTIYSQTDITEQILNQNMEKRMQVINVHWMS